MATTTKAAPKEERVKIKLPLTRTEKDDVTVIINGKKYIIKRGIEVEVPKGVAAAIKNSEEMLAEAYAYESSAAKNFNE